MSRMFALVGFTALFTACTHTEPASLEPRAAPEVAVAEPEPIAFTERVAVSDEPVHSEPAAPTVPTHTFELRRGETLHHFARWSEQPIERIAALSGLSLDGTYEVGTPIVLELNPEDRSRVEARRDSHHQTRASSYLASRGASNTDFYTVKTGDTAWTIARTFEGMPVWLLESLNPSADLELLRPGQQLLVPVFNDVTVSVDEPNIEIEASEEPVLLAPAE